LERIFVGLIEHQRRAWAPFLPELERGYRTRYQQHFSALESYPTHSPVGRKFYEQPWVIDGGSLLYNRLVDREKNVISLLQFGWRIIGQRLIPPDTFWDFFEMFYMGIIDMKEELDDLPIPAVQFTRRDKTGNLLDDNKFVRVGLDDVPDPNNWALAIGDEDGVIDVPLSLFSTIYCQNRPPMNPVMFDHDGSHIIDYLNNPSYYHRQQGVFAKICGRSEPGSELLISESPNAGNPYAMYGRVCCLHEETCLPNQSKSDAIKYALGVSSGMRNYQTRGKFLVKCVPGFVIRHGGGMNDSYNLYNDLNIRTTPAQRADQYVKDPAKRLFSDCGREMFSQLATESMLGLVSDIDHLAERTGLAYEKALVEKIERLETALKVGIQLGITISKFAVETTEQIMDSNSDSYKWLASFTPKHSLTGKFYLGQDALCK
jgi:hypothetical protein